MATGDKYLSISENRLLGWQSLKNLFFDYLDKQSRTMAERVYATGSTFGTETALVADGVDQIKLAGYPPDSVSAVDGLGRFLDFRQRTSDVEDIHFENTLGTEYEVSVQQAPLPGGVFVNPADGMPAWNYYEDIVGFLGTPDLVTDNLDGTITFEVDSITESGHNNHGRQVYVYKNTITKSALTDQLAKQLCTTVYTGGKNKITTTLVGAGGAGTFGQVTVSTTPSHYTVILVGPRVGVDLDLRESTSACFLGTVTGAGLGNAPTVFAMAAQNVFDFDLTLLSDITRLEPASGIDRLKVDVKVIPGDAATDQIRVTNGALSPTTRFKVDGAGLVTTEDSLLVKGGMVVGYDAVPTADKISIGDALFNIDYNSGNPKIQFATPASGGVLVYRRTAKDLTWKMQNVDEVVLAQGPVLKLGDAMFNLDYSAGYPRLQFGNDDYFKFDRTIDTLTWNSNGVLGCFGYADTPGFFVGATSFSLKYNAAGNQVIFDTLDYIEYAKAGDYWMYFINNTEFLRMVVNKLVPINATFALGDTTHFFLTAYITEQFTSILRPPAGKSPYQIDMYGDVVAVNGNLVATAGYVKALGGRVYLGVDDYLSWDATNWDTIINGVTRQRMTSADVWSYFPDGRSTPVEVRIREGGNSVTAVPKVHIIGNAHGGYSGLTEEVDYGYPCPHLRLSGGGAFGGADPNESGDALIEFWAAHNTTTLNQMRGFIGYKEDLGLAFAGMGDIAIGAGAGMWFCSMTQYTNSYADYRWYGGDLYGNGSSYGHMFLSGQIAGGVYAPTTLALGSTGLPNCQSFLKLIGRGAVTSNPITDANYGWVFTKTSGGVAEVFTMDGAGNVNAISPHDENGTWIFDSKNVKTGIRKRVNMEKLVALVELLTGEALMVVTEERPEC